ncbi:MAG: 2-hydroxyacyl-CoA dehydratase family protein, partial [Candidatus Lokiarchaeota archaeon]|nr:2-hydroxyacyl-CoA dehydratase family protein [Candidatus Lokiarchaeota archaeon]
VKAAKDLKIDGIIFNQVSGCPSISNVYNSIMEKFNNDLEIPAILIKFKKIGEDLDEIKGKLANFMKNFK